jgi:hypothetical protein
MEYFEAFDGGHVIDFHGYRAARGVKRGRPKGSRQTEEAKARISAAMSGSGNSMFGKRQSRRTRLLQSEAAKRHWQLRREVIARAKAREAAMRGESRSEQRS